MDAATAKEWFLRRTGEPVSLVDPADLKRCWEYARQHKSPPGSATDMGVFAAICSPGADMRGITLRLQAIAAAQSQPGFAHLFKDGVPDDEILEIYARLPILYPVPEAERNIPSVEIAELRLAIPIARALVEQNRIASPPSEIPKLSMAALIRAFWALEKAASGEVTDEILQFAASAPISAKCPGS
jgi:hypothetical protein